MSVIRVLVVDDEPLLLRGLERSLRGLRPTWATRFANSGVEALAMIEELPVDVIVTDVGMPGMDGISLLRLVRARAPQIARIVLSGEARSTDRMRAILEIHQWLAKPTPVRDLVAVIDLVQSRRTAIASPEVLSTVNGIACLPSSLGFYRKAARAIEENAPLAALSDLIESDVAMSLKVIQLVNTAFFGAPQRVASARRAVQALGLAHVRATLVAAEVGFHPDAEALTAQALFVAALARSFAPPGDDDAHLAGLLHDVASFALGPGLRQRVPHASDGAIASLLLDTWGLPAEVVHAVAFHRDPSRAPDPQSPSLLAVALATALATELRAPSTSPSFVQVRAAALGLDPELCRARAQALAAGDHEPGMSSTMPSTIFLPRSTR